MPSHTGGVERLSRPFGGILFLGISFFFALTLHASGPKPLTFEDRVKAQEAIERVYYDHRIWPKENPQPKPPFEQMVPRSVIEAKVTDYLKKCNALDQFWQRPIQPEQLQAEMDRMARGTKDAETLGELFSALNNDPYLIAECLAKPILADRLIHNWYAFDTRFNAHAREMANESLSVLSNNNFASATEGEYSRIRYILMGITENDSNIDPTRLNSHFMEVHLSQEEFEEQERRARELNETMNLREVEAFFVIERVSEIGESFVEWETRSFQKESFSSWWEAESSSFKAPPALRSDSPGNYRIPTATGVPEAVCAGGKWFRTDMSSLPDPTDEHTAIWTGTEMIVWGGGHEGPKCGRYNPSTDEWTPTSTGTNCPTAHRLQSAIWTGTEMIIWGGISGGYTNSGGRYNPKTDSWIATSTSDNCPRERGWHTAIWTGSEMIIWGGQYSENGSQKYWNTGGRYSPASNTWIGITTGLEARARHTAIWTGMVMVVWGGMGAGGFYSSGARYDPATNFWTTTSTASPCPTARRDHTAVWSGTFMIVWGGADNTGACSSGGLYNVSDNTWQSTNLTGGCPSARENHTAIWTGTEMIVWGGGWNDTRTNTGARYSPNSNTWTGTSTNPNCPLSRWNHTAVWTGTEMIIWGGSTLNVSMNTGARYSPATNSWTPTGPAILPSPRQYHSAIWTGSEMIVWGGSAYTNIYDRTGGRYAPAIDTWTSTSTGAGCLAGRDYHTAIWTGTEMIVWGGRGWNSGDTCYKDGSRYNPISDGWTIMNLGPTERCLHTAV